jgi:pilus assembly protein CpaE
MFRILSATQDASLTDRLIAALDGTATVVRSDPSLRALQDAVASVRPDLIALDIDDSQQAVERGCEAIQELLEIDSLRPIVAIGNDETAATVLRSMRAGARDFIGREVSNETLRRQIIIQLNRLTNDARPASGRLVVITSGQPNDGESLFAVNYAVLRAKANEHVLLIDFNLPASVAGAALNIDLNYTLHDAVSDLSRMDRTLLSSALGRHRASGLYVLPLAAVSDNIIDLSGASILSLLNTLRTLFSEIIVNFGGLRHSGLGTELLNAASESFLVSSQLFTSVKACKELISRLVTDSAARGKMVLVVCEYDNEIRLTNAQMASTLGIARSVKIPKARAALANALNKGEPLVLDQPRSPYAKALMALADGGTEKSSTLKAERPAVGGLLRRLAASVS